jgi:hypothetical protein
MSLRPFAFGVRLRDKDRTVKVRGNARKPGRYVVEETRDGGRSKEREHASLNGALRDAAASWRKRLN